MDLSIVALRSLYEISQRGTMTAAAEALGYTPGAVSQHVASLSRAVGRPVVVQSGRSVRLTDAGLILLEHARRVIESEAVVDRELHAQVAEVAGTLTLGIFGSSAVILEQALPGLRTDYPALRVEVRELRETTHENPGLAVSRSDVDLALGLDYPDAPVERLPDVEHRVLATERFGVAGLEAEQDEAEDLAALFRLDRPGAVAAQKPGAAGGEEFGEGIVAAERPARQNGQARCLAVCVRHRWRGPHTPSAFITSRTNGLMSFRLHT